MKKSSKLRKLIQSPKLEFILEAHNGLSAKIVEEAGLKGIWAGGLSISAALGVRDNNEASWTQVLEVLEFMSDHTSIPILLDGDTGFGDFNNVRRLIKKLEQRHVAGVCIEDKIFPKTNSFYHGEQQPLADIDEFCGKIKAGKDAQTDPDFCLVARVEALITGWGMEEALRRAYAYADAGADAILIHSKLKNPSEIIEFMNKWDRRKPVVIVPTTYADTPTEAFQKAGISLIVWANHVLRASIAAMQKAAQQIQREQSVKNVDPYIVSVQEIFRLQNMDELKEAENLYRPAAKSTKAVILAASRGVEFESLTADRPKCMLEVYGKPIIASLSAVFNENNVKDITAVVGYKHEAVDVTNLKKIINPGYESKGILNSLYEARNVLDGQTVISYGDILFAREVLRDLLDAPGDIVLTVDSAWIQGGKENRLKDIVYCEEPHSNLYLGKKISTILDIKSQKNKKDAHGEWIGLLKLSAQGSAVVKEELEKFAKEDPQAFAKADLVILLSRLINKGIPLTASYCHGSWLDVDGFEDLAYANKTSLQSLKSS